MILARLIDENWRRAIISEQENLGQFFAKLFASPLSLVLFTTVVLIVLSQTPVFGWVRRTLRRG